MASMLEDFSFHFGFEFDWYMDPISFGTALHRPFSFRTLYILGFRRNKHAAFVFVATQLSNMSSLIIGEHIDVEI